MLFLCVDLFDKGRPIEGRVPSQALAVAVAAGQLSGQEQQHSHHQPVHHGHGGQSLVLQVAWSGPGGLYGPTWALAMCASRTHQLNWPPAARTTVALLGPRGSGHMVALNLSTGAAATRDQQSGDKSRQSRESGRESLTLPLFWLLDDSGFPLTQPFLPAIHSFK